MTNAMVDVRRHAGDGGGGPLPGGGKKGMGNWQILHPGDMAKSWARLLWVERLMRASVGFAKHDSEQTEQPNCSIDRIFATAFQQSRRHQRACKHGPGMLLYLHERRDGAAPDEQAVARPTTASTG